MTDTNHLFLSNGPFTKFELRSQDGKGSIVLSSSLDRDGAEIYCEHWTLILEAYPPLRRQVDVFSADRPNTVQMPGLALYMKLMPLFRIFSSQYGIVSGLLRPGYIRASQVEFVKIWFEHELWEREKAGSPLYVSSWIPRLFNTAKLRRHPLILSGNQSVLEGLSGVLSSRTNSNIGFVHKIEDWVYSWVFNHSKNGFFACGIERPYYSPKGSLIGPIISDRSIKVSALKLNSKVGSERALTSLQWHVEETLKSHPRDSSLLLPLLSSISRWKKDLTRISLVGTNGRPVEKD